MRKIETLTQNSAGIWRTRSFDLDDPIDAVRYFARNPYAWPGGYANALIMNDGGILCHKCVLENYREILIDSTGKSGNTGWDAMAITYLEEELEDTQCSHCSSKLTKQHKT